MTHLTGLRPNLYLTYVNVRLMSQQMRSPLWGELAKDLEDKLTVNFDKSLFVIESIEDNMYWESWKGKIKIQEEKELC